MEVIDVDDNYDFNSETNEIDTKREIIKPIGMKHPEDAKK